MGDLLWEMAGSKLTPEDFVGAAFEFLRGGKGKGEVDEAVVEEGGAVFDGVGHRVLVLANERPVGEPVLVLEGEEAEEGVVLLRQSYGGQVSGGGVDDRMLFLGVGEVGVEESFDFVGLEKSMETGGLVKEGEGENSRR